METGRANMSIFSRIRHLPLNWLGLDHIPAVPIEIDGLLDSALKLRARTKEIEPAKQGLTNSYTINATTATGLEFLYGEKPETDTPDALDNIISDLEENPASVLNTLRKALTDHGAADNKPGDLSSLQSLSLVGPDQWSMAWTNFQNTYQVAKPLIPEFAATLTDAESASQQFWPMIANNGLAYNLLFLKKVSNNDLADLKSHFSAAWSKDWETLSTNGTLYLIDLRIFASLKPAKVSGFQRFVPSTLTLLQQDPVTKDLTPIAITVAGQNNAGAQYFVRTSATDSAWLYALQAAKVSVTVYGIWLGHVYHWHIISASMQMTMYNNIDKDHGLYQLIAPQANFLLQFDELLLILWGSIAPPTSVDTAWKFLELMNTFAFERSFFADDPLTTLATNGIKEADFTINTPWDKYPIVGQFLTLWDAVSSYIQVFVDTSYVDDAAVVADKQLQAWITEATDEDEGNIQGLPANVTTRAELKTILTSLIYRIAAHGGSRMRPSAYPVQSFVANFPPCLQQTRIPKPTDTLSTVELLEFLPKTGTIGDMMTFYNIFVFSAPYVPFIPEKGVTTDLFFPDGPDAPRNKALIAFRESLIAFIKDLEPKSPQIHQWPLNIET